MRLKQVVRVLKSVFASFMAVLLAVGLMPLPAANGQAYAADMPLAAGSSAVLSAGDGEEGEDAPADAHTQPDSGELSAQAATGKLTYSSNTLNFYLYSGYNGGGESGALKAYTIKNTGTVKVTGIKLASFSANKTGTIVYDGEGNPVITQNTVPYVLTDEYGTVRYDSLYLDDLSSWANGEAFDLDPGQSKKLYFTVASPFRAGYTLKTGTNVTDTVQIVSNNTDAKTVNLHCEVYDPNGSYAKFGTELDSSGNVAGTPSINFGTVAAGTEVFDEDGSYNKYQMFYIQNAATAKDSKRGGYPDLTVTDITIEDDTAGVFQGAQVGYGDGLYGASRMTLGYDSYWPRAYTVDATYVPAGTYTANLCFHLSPYKVNSNAGNTTTGVIKIPMTVKVTGANPNIPVAVTNLTAEAGNGYVGLSWDRLPKDTTNSSGYVVWRDKCEVDDYGTLGWDYIGEVLELDETMYVDKDVVNGTTYTYYVTPRFGGNYDFVKKSNYASATPSGSAQGRPLAPYIHRSDTQNGSVRLTWSLDPETQHQFDKGDGKGVDYDSSLAPYPAIDHFNIYQDGSLVATYSQNSYESHYDEMYQFPNDYLETKSSYYWVYDVPVDDAYQYHKFCVSAVTKTGAESYLSIEDEECSGSDVPLTTRLDASWTQGSGVSLAFGWETETWIEWVGSGISYTVERKEAGESSFQTVQSDRTDDYEAAWVDETAGAGKTYVYRVIGTNSAGVGTSKEVTISTSGASAALPQFGYELWSVTEGTLSASASVWSDNTKVELLRKKDDAADYTVVASKTVSNNSVEFTDTPENGTYTYYMRFSLGGCVDSSQPFVWNRAENTSYDNMLKPPGAVTSVTIMPGDRKFQFFWDPPATGGKVESYQICEYLESPDGPSIDMGSMQVVPGSETSYLCENTYHNGEWYPPFNGSTYRFVMRAVNAAGVSDWSYLGEVSPNGDDWTIEPPAAPVIDVENTKIQWSDEYSEYVLHVEWTAGESGGVEKGFYVKVADPNGGSGGTYDPDLFSYDYRTGATSEAAIPRGTYTIRVAAYNSRAPLGDDFAGGVASSHSYTYGAATAAPLAPRVYSDAPDDEAYIRLNLQPAEGDPNATFITSYEISRSETQGGPYSAYATVAANGDSAVDYYDTNITGYGYSDSGWVNAKTYYYQVVAKNSEGASAPTARPQTAANISNGQRDAARSVNTSMANLPDSADAAAVLAAKETIANLRHQYNALTAPARATFVEATNLEKLEACETALLTAEDAAAAQAVDAQVTALGVAEGIAALIDQDAVTAKATAIAAARAAYNALTPAQKTLIASGTPDALEAAESAIEVAQARVLIKAIPAASAMTVDSLDTDRNKVVNARAAYNGLRPDQQTVLENLATSSGDSFNNAAIMSAEATIADNEALADVKTLIDALPAKSDITRDNRAAVADQVATARSAYDALTDAQKAVVGDISKLTDAEAQIAALDREIAAEVNAVQSKVDALDAGKVADGTTSVDVAIEAAQEVRSAYENLADDAQSLVDATNLEAYETAIKSKQQADFTAEIADSAATITGDTPIALGGTAAYAATAVDNTTVTWSSDSSSVATVDAETGEVTGVASGTAAIIATYSRDGYDGATLVASVSKQVEVFDVSVTGPDKVVFGSTPRLTLTSSVEGGFTWASSDSRVVSVSQDGTCKALAVGTVVVTAQSSVYPTVVARKTVQVVPAPISISLSATQFMYNGKSQRPAVTVTYAYGTVPAGGYTISWPADTTSAGTKTITVRGVGNYAGTAIATYRINMASKQMFRLYNPYSGEHFYTADANERNTLTGLGWRYEGVGWNAPTTGANVYRLYNRFSGDHHFTTDTGEKDACVRAGWTYEGVGWKSGGSVKVYREYNPYAEAFYHNYTASANEHRTLCSIGWKDEGIGWYGV